jgi:DNA (cytosine-5)-methyltransferase 1
MGERAKRSEQDISAIMRRVHSEGTEPEARLSAALREVGLVIETNRADLPGKPDIVIPARRLAIFIDGDFWHGGQWRLRGKTALEEQFPETGTRDYWLTKIRRNMRRDSAMTADLLNTGWSVLRFWESNVRKQLETCVALACAACEGAAQPHTSALLPHMTVAEFFAGIGLMRMGLEQSGWRVVFANDIDEQKRTMYAAQFSGADEHFFSDDVHVLPTDYVPTVTLATASFPCNDLSLAGARAGLDGHESSAFWGFARILREMGQRRPPLVLLENVPGLLTSHQGRDVVQTLHTLNELGYRVDAFVVDAARFVPQSRQRLFIIGVQDSLFYADDEPNAPDALQASDTRPKALIDVMQANPDIRWAIRPLPSLPPTNHRIERILDDLPDDAPEWWSPQRTAYVLDQMSPAHREKAEQMIAGEEWAYGTVFRRMRKGKSMAELRTDGIAGCLRTPRGGSGRQMLVKAGQGAFRVRLLTPRECARLMGADEYTIHVPNNQALFGFGDAVCVPVIDWIATYYLNPLVNEAIRGRLLSSF